MHLCIHKNFNSALLAIPIVSFSGGFSWRIFFPFGFIFGRRSVFLTCSKLWHYAHALFQLPQQQYIIIFLTHISFRIAVFSVSSLFATPYLLSSFVFYFYFYYYCFFDGFICSIWCERAACNHTHKTHAHECMRIDVQFFDCLVLELHIFFGFPYHLI